MTHTLSSTPASSKEGLLARLGGLHHSTLAGSAKSSSSNIFGNLLNFFGRPSSKSKASRKELHMELQQKGSSTYRREISHWQQARALRTNAREPLSYALQEVYTDVMLDTHLSAVINNRILRLQNRRYVVYDASGQVDAERTTWLEQNWFQDIINYVVSSIFYGYSLIWIKSVDPSSKRVELELIDRRHVVPERALILEDMRDKDHSLSYLEWPEELLYAQLGDSLGLLEKAAPLTMLKRHSWANWDEFEQVFGLPIRIARVPNLETKDTYRIAKWLEDMGTAAYAVLPDSVQVEVKESRRSDAYQVFKEKILCVNAELSKLINGQTMTVDGGSSRSQSEVHMRTENEITSADIRKVLCWLNGSLLPALHARGFGFEKGDRVDIWDETPASQQILIDKELLRAGMRLSPEYISRTYGVHLAEDEQEKAS